MAHQTSFAFDYERHTSALDLRSEHYEEFQRLLKNLRHGAETQLLLVEYNDAGYRDELIRRIEGVPATEQLRGTQVVLSRERHPDFAAAEASLRAAAEEHDAVHVLGGDFWFDRARWEAFNLRREAVFAGVAARLLLWLGAEEIRGMATLAPDLWSWRAGVFDFTIDFNATSRKLIAGRVDSIDARSMAERARRIVCIGEYLATPAAAAAEVRLPLLDEQAELLRSLGR